MSKWPTVKLDDVFKRVKDEVIVQDDETYVRLTIRMNGNGIVQRDRVPGHEIGTKKQFIARAGQLVLSKIDARNGAFGILPSDCDNAIITGNFWAFDADHERLLPKFFNYLTKTGMFVEFCIRASEGTTNRLYLQEDEFLAQEIMLPPLAEQRRVVARIEELAAQIREARTLRLQAAEEAEALNASMLVGLLPKSSSTKALGNVIAQDSKISYGVLVPGPDIEDGVPFVRIQDLAIRNPPPAPAKRIAPEIDAQYRRTRLNGGEILIGVVGSIGKVGVAPASWAGANIARAVCRIVPDTSVDRDYLAMVLSAQPSQDYFRETTRTLAQPTLNIAQLSKTPIPVPPLPEQRRIVSELDALQAEMGVLKCLQAETAAELDALLPSILDKAFKGDS